MTTQQRGRGSTGRSGRGRARYSGRLRAGMAGSWRRSQVTKPPAPPMGPVLAQIDRTDLADVSGVEESSAKISDCAEVASFSWLNRKESTILVPGWLSDTSHRWTPKAFFFWLIHLTLSRKASLMDAIIESHPVKGRCRGILSRSELCPMPLTSHAAVC